MPALDRDQARALVAGADTGPQALRTRAAVRLLLHNALRVDEVCTADLADLGEDRLCPIRARTGHQEVRLSSSEP
jgi:integrase